MNAFIARKKGTVSEKFIRHKLQMDKFSDENIVLWTKERKIRN